MRVSIDHSQSTSGIFKKKTHYAVSVTVNFSEEEKHVLSGQRDAIVVDRGPDSEREGKFSLAEQEDLHNAFCLKVSDLIRGKPDRYTFSTPAEAKQYVELVRGSLQNLKDYITENSEAPSGSDSFEL